MCYQGLILYRDVGYKAACQLLPTLLSLSHKHHTKLSVGLVLVPKYYKDKTVVKMGSLNYLFFTFIPKSQDAMVITITDKPTPKCLGDINSFVAYIDPTNPYSDTLPASITL